MDGKIHQQSVVFEYQLETPRKRIRSYRKVNFLVPEHIIIFRDAVDYRIKVKPFSLSQKRLGHGKILPDRALCIKYVYLLYLLLSHLPSALMCDRFSDKTVSG